MSPLTADTTCTDEQASKRAASAFFFELLVLGTKDAIKLDQKEPFGDVDIRAKDKLFEEITV
jgi:cohesin complex subunit SCC1